MGLCQDGSPRRPAALWHSTTKRQRQYAIAYCNACPLLESCRSWTLKYLVLEPGVRVVSAGLTESQIMRERKRLGIPYPKRPVAPTSSPGRILTVTPQAELDQVKRRTILHTAHYRGKHDMNPHPDCSRCAQ